MEGKYFFWKKKKEISKRQNTDIYNRELEISLRSNAIPTK